MDNNVPSRWTMRECVIFNVLFEIWYCCQDLYDVKCCGLLLYNGVVALYFIIATGNEWEIMQSGVPDNHSKYFQCIFLHTTDCEIEMTLWFNISLGYIFQFYAVTTVLIFCYTHLYLQYIVVCGLVRFSHQCLLDSFRKI